MVTINLSHFTYPLVLLSFLLSGCSSGSSSQDSIDSVSTTWRLSSITVDTDIDGQADEIYQLIYDGNGLSIGEWEDSNADGTNDGKFEYVYQSGLLDQSLLDSDLDGITDTLRQFQYDGTGFLTTESIDDGNDGSIDRNIAYVSGFGSSVVASLDDDNDGVVDRGQSYMYDAAGSIVSVETDVDGDGVADNKETIEYSTTGQITQALIDLGGEGGFDVRVTYKYVVAICDVRSNHQPRSHTCISQ